MMKKLNKDNAYLIFAFFVVILFAYITYLTPLAGDDWGYAVGGSGGNPFILAYNQYFSWSGRYFAELWNYAVAPNKMIWNVLNPLIFGAIYIMIYKIISPKINRILINFVILFLMLYVKDQVRMETYSWIAGTTYTIPLLFSLIYVYLCKKIMIDGDRKVPYYVILGFLAFYIGLAMENIAASMLVINAAILLYAYVYKIPKFKLLLFPVLSSVVSFLLLRLSPGANYRLHNSHSEWLRFNLFEQIQLNWVNFIKYTFVDNKYLIFALGIITITFAIKRYGQYKSNKTVATAICSISGLTIFLSMAELLYSWTGLSILRFCFDIYEFDYALIITSVVYLSFVISIIVLLFITLVGDESYEGFLYVVIAGVSNLAMLFSPIFGSRSSIYTIYYIILLVCYLLAFIKLEKRYSFIVTICLLAMIFGKTREFIFKYRLVAGVERDRLDIIEYYKDHPESDEYWFPAMPIYTIHSGNFDEDDENHRIYFLRYYGLDDTKEVKFDYTYYWDGE